MPSETYPQHFTLQIKLAYPASGTGASATPAETVTEYLPLLLPASNTGTNPYQGSWFDPLTTTAAQDMSRPVVTDIAPPQPPYNGTPNWVPGSAVLTRTLTQVTDVPTLKANYTDPATDPYTFALYSDAASNMTTVTGANLGVLAFNPRLQGQPVSVSYLTYDWHIIREDEDIPSYTPGMMTNGQLSPIHLTIDHLKRVGDVQDDQSLNPGLFRASDLAANTTGYDIVVLDTDTGQSIGLSAPPTGTTNGDVYDLDNQNGPTTTANGNTEPNPGSFLVSYQNGYITLPNSTGYGPTSNWASAQHQHVRIFYAGDYNWAVALQKGPSLYSQGSNGALNAGQYGVSIVGNVVHLHFPISDLGQTVDVHNITYVDANGNTQQMPDVTGSTIMTDFSDSNYISLGTLPTPIGPNNTINIGAVQGISARSVVVWKERGQWKSRSVSTILNQ